MCTTYIYVLTPILILCVDYKTSSVNTMCQQSHFWDIYVRVISIVAAPPRLHFVAINTPMIYSHFRLFLISTMQIRRIIKCRLFLQYDALRILRGYKMRTRKQVWNVKWHIIYRRTCACALAIIHHHQQQRVVRLWIINGN